MTLEAPRGRANEQFEDKMTNYCDQFLGMVRRDAPSHDEFDIAIRLASGLMKVSSIEGEMRNDLTLVATAQGVLQDFILEAVSLHGPHCPNLQKRHSAMFTVFQKRVYGT